VTSYPSEAETILCGIDLGSNSFHMVIARVGSSGRFTFIDRRKEYVRLAAGLKPDGSLEVATRKRAIDCLSRFGDRLQNLSERNVRVVGTNTFRKAKDPEFIREAQEAIGKTIHIVSGHEEARLVYQGVGFSVTEPGVRLVVDIGGGSTEFILGRDEDINEATSHYCGCVSWTLRFFPDGKITKSAYEKAVMAARREIGNDVRRFRGRHDLALGSSGTINAIERLCGELGLSDEGISVESLKALEKQIFKAGHLNALNFESISQERQQVLPGGLAILRAVFRTLRVKQMRAVSTALREGVLLDLWGRKQNKDVRGETVSAMQDRFEVDREQATRVQETVLNLFDQCAEGIGVPRHPFRNWVRYAAAMHEIGLFLGFSGYHKHGAYLLANGDLPGFSWQEQRALAALVMGHRGKFEPNRMRRLKPGRELPMELVLLLRVARRLHRRRSPKPLPAIHATGKPGNIILRFPEGWLDERPLTVADLNQEGVLARKQEIQLDFE